MTIRKLLTNNILMKSNFSKKYLVALFYVFANVLKCLAS